MSYKPGDFVKVSTKSEDYQGRFVQKKKDFTVIKLDSGYNIGLKNNKVISVKLLKKYSSKPKKEKVSQKKNLPKITILHTGGTIASKVDYNTGAVIPRFTSEELLRLFPELRKIANINSRLISNMLSENMRFTHYNIIAKEIEKEVKKGVKGVILTQGTDTIHYTGAALSFILEGLNIPVVIVGAQRSSDRGSSDAAINLISASMFITNSNYSGVAVCMHENPSDDACLIMNGLKTRKMHSSRRDAFRPINETAIARIKPKEKKIEYLQKIVKKTGKLKVRPIKESLNVGIIKVKPNMYAKEFLVYKNYDALIIEGTGLGHAPILTFDKPTKEHEKIKKAIKELAKRMPVVMTTQTIYGRVNMNVYAPGREQREIGVIGHGLDMLTETAYIKLAWLLSNHKKDAKKLFGKNLRGEINTRTEKDTFLI
jgi:glutamyl-tRNA(Gln) amidotransferase subunit D